MAGTVRICDHCSTSYVADNRNLKRGWGLTCSKKCAASKRNKKTRKKTISEKRDLILSEILKETALEKLKKYVRK